MDYIEIGLNGEAPLKVIMRGSVEIVSDDNIYTQTVMTEFLDTSGGAVI